MRASVYSVYMANISPDIVRVQRVCVQRFLPKDWVFEQVLFNTNHGDALRSCVDRNRSEVSIFLDIDCIPLSHLSFSYFFDAKWSVKSGALIGAAQRANHIDNKGHLYVGPFCMAFKNSVYRELGSPGFTETYRGDVGEELTYVWQENNRAVYLFYPSSVEKPLWNLIDGVSQFGIGTTYEELFYHAFCIRDGTSQLQFFKKCRAVLEADDARIREKQESLVR